MSPSDTDQLYPLLNNGLALYNAGKPFEAHEYWEFAWKVEVGRNKLTLQALIQIAAGLYKQQVGNRRGPSKLLAKALEKIEDIRAGCASWLGIDLVQLEADTKRALADADAFANGLGESIFVPRLPRVVGEFGVLYLHGFASSPGSKKASWIVPRLRNKGFFVQVPDLNEDDFENLTISRALALSKRQLRPRTLIIGSSMGGYLAALLAEKDERVKGLILMAPAFEMSSRLAKRYGGAAIAKWRESGSTMVEHYGYGREHPLAYAFYEDAQRHAGHPKLRVPTHILQGRGDDVVPAAMVERIADRHGEHVRLDLLDDDHGLGNSMDQALKAAERMLERLGFEHEPDEIDPELALRNLPED